MGMYTEQLREQLKGYYGTAMFSGFPMAMIDLQRVEQASDEEIVRIANSLGLTSGGENDE